MPPSLDSWLEEEEDSGPPAWLQLYLDEPPLVATAPRRRISSRRKRPSPPPPASPPLHHVTQLQVFIDDVSLFSEALYRSNLQMIYGCLFDGRAAYDCYSIADSRRCVLSSAAQTHLSLPIYRGSVIHVTYTLSNNTTKRDCLLPRRVLQLRSSSNGDDDCRRGIGAVDADCPHCQELGRSRRETTGKRLEKLSFSRGV